MWLPSGSFQDLTWELTCPKSGMIGLKTTCRLHLPLALFRVQYESPHGQKMIEDVKTTYGHELPLALFRVQYGSPHSQKSDMKI